MLALRVTTDADTTMIDHHIPEELDGLVPVATAFQVGNALVADNLGNLCIGVLTC